MLGDDLSDFSIDVPELIEMIARLDDPARKQMTEMVQGYLSMAHYAFQSDVYSSAAGEPNFPWPYLRDQVESKATSESYQYVCR